MLLTVSYILKGRYIADLQTKLCVFGLNVRRHWIIFFVKLCEVTDQALEPLRLQYSKLLEEREDKSELVMKLRRDYEEELHQIKKSKVNQAGNVTNKKKDDKIKKMKEERKSELKKVSKELKKKLNEINVC
jgi:biopolymer transport protein ExbB/TolQ